MRTTIRVGGRNGIIFGGTRFGFGGGNVIFFGIRIITNGIFFGIRIFTNGIFFFGGNFDFWEQGFIRWWQGRVHALRSYKKKSYVAGNCGTRVHCDGTSEHSVAFDGFFLSYTWCSFIANSTATLVWLYPLRKIKN